MLVINKHKIDDIRIGGKKILAVYSGSRLVWYIHKTEPELPDEVYSCFGSGVWLDLYVWNDNDTWRD